MVNLNNAQARIAYDHGRGKYSRRTGLAFNQDWHNAGLDAVWDAAIEARWNDEFKKLGG